jgi:hypothetical protein
MKFPFAGVGCLRSSPELNDVANNLKRFLIPFFWRLDRLTPRLQNQPVWMS